MLSTIITSEHHHQRQLVKQEVRRSEVLVDGDAAVSPPSWWMLDDVPLFPALTPLTIGDGAVSNDCAKYRGVL